MENTVNNPAGAVTGADSTNNVVAAEGSANVAGQQPSLREVVKQATGRDYASDDAAMEGIKNTYAMVGKVGQNTQQSMLPADIMAKVAEIDNIKTTLTQQAFYNEHPEFNTPAAKELISAMGNDPAKIVETAAFKNAFTAVKAQADIEKSKSVLHSSARLGQATDKISQAREALKVGNDASAKQSAVAAVLDAYEE